jgi:hypothetical protein
MTQNAIATKWRFVVDFEDDETQEISGTVGHASDREECETYIEDEVQYQCSHGRTPFNAEAGEVCAKCDGEGKISGRNDERVICQACGGHIGPITPFSSYLDRIVPKRTASLVTPFPPIHPIDSLEGILPALQTFPCHTNELPISNGLELVRDCLRPA